MRNGLQDYVILTRLVNVDEMVAIKHGYENEIGSYQSQSTSNDFDDLDPNQKVSFCFVSEDSGKSYEDVKNDLKEHKLSYLNNLQNLPTILKLQQKLTGNDISSYIVYSLIFSNEEFDKYVESGEILTGTGYYEDENGLQTPSEEAVIKNPKIIIDKMAKGSNASICITADNIKSLANVAEEDEDEYDDYNDSHEQDDDYGNGDFEENGGHSEYGDSMDYFRNKYYGNNFGDDSYNFDDDSDEMY